MYTTSRSDQSKVVHMIHITVLGPHLLRTRIITERFPNCNPSYIFPMKTLEFFS